MTIAEGVHAQAISGLIHRGLVRQFGRDCRAKMVVLHEAPYGSLEASLVAELPSQSEWMKASTVIRLEHELTHLATKRLLGEMRINLLDELIADAMGMIRALGCFSADLFGACLGLDATGMPQPGKRWQTYVQWLKSTDTLEAIRMVMERAKELEEMTRRVPSLLDPEHSMSRLNWLCRQRLDKPMVTP